MRAIQAVTKGTPFFSPEIAKTMLEDYMRFLQQRNLQDSYELLTERDLPERIAEGARDMTNPKEIPTGLTMDELEKLAIMKALDECAGNRTHAAGRLKKRTSRTGHAGGSAQGKSFHYTGFACRFRRS